MNGAWLNNYNKKSGLTPSNMLICPDEEEAEGRINMILTEYHHQLPAWGTSSKKVLFHPWVWQSLTPLPPSRQKAWKQIKWQDCRWGDLHRALNWPNNIAQPSQLISMASASVWFFTLVCFLTGYLLKNFQIALTHSIFKLKSIPLNQMSQSAEKHAQD